MFVYEGLNLLKSFTFFVLLAHKSLLTGELMFHNFSTFEPLIELWVVLKVSIRPLLNRFVFLSLRLWLMIFLGFISISSSLFSNFLISHVGIEHLNSWILAPFCSLCNYYWNRTFLVLLWREDLRLDFYFDDTRDKPRFEEEVVSMLRFFLNLVEMVWWEKSAWLVANVLMRFIVREY